MTMSQDSLEALIQEYKVKIVSHIIWKYFGKNILFFYYHYHK